MTDLIGGMLPRALIIWLGLRGDSEYVANLVCDLRASVQSSADLATDSLSFLVGRSRQDLAKGVSDRIGYVRTT